MSTAALAEGIEQPACAVCGLRDSRPYRAAAYAIGDQRFDLVRCRQCGLVYLDPRPSGPVLEALYGDPDYFTEGYNLGVESENYFERGEELLAEHDQAVAELEREIGLAAGDVLELGSAGGFFLEAARRRGHRVKGVELSRFAWRYSVEELGLEVYHGRLEDAPYEGQSFDLAVADNVLEHTGAPDRVLRDLRALLRPGGHLLLVVPAYVNSAWYRRLLDVRKLIPSALFGAKLLELLKLGDGDGGYPYHILEFDRATLLRLLREAGFEVISVQGSVPLPAHLFKDHRPGVRTRILRGVFRGLDFLMRRRCLPPARLRVLARRA